MDNGEWGMDLSSILVILRNETSFSWKIMKGEL